MWQDNVLFCRLTGVNHAATHVYDFCASRTKQNRKTCLLQTDRLPANRLGPLKFLGCNVGVVCLNAFPSFIKNTKIPGRSITSWSTYVIQPSSLRDGSTKASKCSRSSSAFSGLVLRIATLRKGSRADSTCCNSPNLLLTDMRLVRPVMPSEQAPTPAGCPK